MAKISGWIGVLFVAWPMPLASVGAAELMSAPDGARSLVETLSASVDLPLPWIYAGLAGASAAAIVFGLMVVWFGRLNHRLRDEITRHVGVEAALRQEASTDGLTGLPNRRYFLDMAAREISKAGRFDVPLVVLLIDIDHSGAIKHRHGLAAGDDLVRHLAALCKEQLRDVDIIGRMEGEAFAVLLTHANPVQGRLVAERLRAAVENTPVLLGEAVRITCSVGVASCGAGVAPDRILAGATAALRQAKANGSNSVCLAEADRSGLVGQAIGWSSSPGV